MIKRLVFFGASGDLAGRFLLPALTALQGPTQISPPTVVCCSDTLEGGSKLSVRGDAAEASWRVMAPVLEAWADGAVPLEEYPAGSSGPPPRV